MLSSASVVVPSVTCKGATHPRGNWILSGDIIKKKKDPRKTTKRHSTNSQWSENITDFKKNLKTLLTLNTEPVSTEALAKLPTDQSTFHISPAPWQKSLAHVFFFFSHAGYTITIYPPGLELNKGKRKWKSISVHEHGGDVLWKPCPLPEALWKPQAQRSRCGHFPSTAQRGEQALAWQG